MDWTLLGLRRIVHAEGADVNHSAAERAAGESIWVPTALLPSVIPAAERALETGSTDELVGLLCESVRGQVEQRHGKAFEVRSNNVTGTP